MKENNFLLPSVICVEGDFISFSTVLFVIITDDPVFAVVAMVTKNRNIVQFINFILQNVQNLIFMKDESQVL